MLKNEMGPSTAFAEPESLVKLAVEAKEKAYVPYSGFHVGAALYADNGKVYTGCNVEKCFIRSRNMRRKNGCCQGNIRRGKKILAIAVSSDSNNPTMPCGICRQVIRANSCSPDMPLYLSNRSGEYKVYHFAEMLPYSFKQSDMEDIG